LETKNIKKNEQLEFDGFILVFAILLLLFFFTFFYFSAVLLLLSHALSNPSATFFLPPRFIPIYSHIFVHRIR